ncbi:hypothetical protein PMAYCL1PPCAC_19433 [Pristionchus mayeri]|uniref:poly(ADP-ribose) glycohydrolase n=1 Tax=Pristionchus mayeri TaxID=1317129 RepID=A0AAN5CRH8_9BILA|nr:hypothetical protein PMAYCL1PPCAC_19433 [Pristionchus mayeri]
MSESPSATARGFKRSSQESKDAEVAGRMGDKPLTRPSRKKAKIDFWSDEDEEEKWAEKAQTRLRTRAREMAGGDVQVAAAAGLHESAESRRDKKVKDEFAEGDSVKGLAVDGSEESAESPEERNIDDEEMEEDAYKKLVIDEREESDESPDEKEDKDEFESDEGKDEKVAEKPMSARSQSKKTAKVSVDDEEERAQQAAAEDKKKRQRKDAIRGCTSLWRGEESYANVEKPWPSARGRTNFCWFDLSEGWSEDTTPKAVPVDHVDWHFNYYENEWAALPFSEQQKHRSLGTSSRPRDELIAEAMLSFSNGVRDLEELETGIRTYWRDFRAVTLRKMVKDQSEEEIAELLETISKIAGLAVRAKHLVTKSLPALVSGSSVESVTMSQEQASCLLAYAFFCTVLPRPNFNHFSFHLWHTQRAPIYVEKMKFILHYFRTVVDEMPRGTLTFSRQAYREQVNEASFCAWTEPLSELYATPEGLIEEMEGCLQVDFANEYIGGGVTNTGAVQEEIRFMCCPEMFVSMLLCDHMDYRDAILIQGAQQYSAYEGYASSLRHVPMELRRDEPRDQFGRARSYLVAIDAHCYQNKASQYKSRFITRELIKAYAGFMPTEGQDNVRPIATGNWGCGVFNGDKELKSLIQLIAASKAGRPMIYVTFQDERFADQLDEVAEVLKAFKVKTGQLFNLLVQFVEERQPKQGVFDFVRASVQAGL